MRALFLIPGDSVSQLQVLPAVAAAADQLGFQVQVACSPEAGTVWSLLPAVEKILPIAYGKATLADWTNLLGLVRDPDFQLCINLVASGPGGRAIDLLLSMSHIPTRVAAAGFSATERIVPSSQGWIDQRLEAYLGPVGVRLDAAAYRLPIARADLDKASAALPQGSGPMLLLAPTGGAGDWPAPHWQALPERIQTRLSDLRSLTLEPTAPSPSSGSLRRRAAQVAAADVVLASDPVTIELALLCGVPLVALGRDPASLPQRQGVTGLGEAAQLQELSIDPVLQALGLG
ncbi:lipopolysaccharide heptosyltransferase family protein [Synechococcus sp. CCY9201]|uniref:glycosyltransferase family 9 protein n=1 Tax=Synechococcus sp. CCY9201 TaxID=174697 RepID=UPI002B21680B|nr:lipopolysaccharide heptosyltransferase family protein [Synechococcus sp. CCY9201]MEA5473538.1 lipopolysaccharide heptosyltransferase family protein [Synechococcus sp. CCY9201]